MRPTAKVCWGAFAPLFVAAAVCGQPTARVEMLDGSTAEGVLIALTDKALELDRAGSRESVDRDRVLQLKLSATPDAPPLNGSAVVTLIDGSRLPIADPKIAGFEIDEREARFTIGRSFSPATPAIRVATSAVKSVVLATNSRHREAWNRLVTTDRSSDIVAVLRKEGATIDPVDCTVDSLSSEAVVVRLDGEAISVPAAKVYGVVFADMSAKADDAKSTAVLESNGGFRLAAGRLWTDGAGSFRAANDLLDAEVIVPRDRVRRVDMSAGRVRWLGDLRLVRHRWRPYHGFPAGLSEAHRPPGMAVDRSLVGGPLRIVDPTRYPLPGSEEAFERGVAVRGGSETVYELPRGFQWFQATAGIDPETAQSGHVLLQLFADDDLVYEHVVDGSGPLPVRVPTHGARRLTILVGHGERFDIGDYLNLGSARVTR